MWLYSEQQVADKKFINKRISKWTAIAQGLDIEYF